MDGFFEKYGLLCFILLLYGITFIHIDPNSSFATKDTYKYRAIVDGKIRHFSKCYKIHGHNVCDDGDGDEFLVEDYWKNKD